MNKEPGPEQLRNSDDAELAGGPSCETLNLLVSQPPRPGLEQRVMARLRAEPESLRIRWWQQLRSRPARWSYAAVTAALLATAAITARHSDGGYHSARDAQSAGSSASGTPAAQPSSVVPHSPGSFGTAGSMRVPPTLKPLYVPAPPRRNPTAQHPATGPTAARAKAKPKKKPAGSEENVSATPSGIYPQQ